MKKLIFFIFLFACVSSYGQGLWPITATKTRWANGMAFSSKSSAQLAAFNNASDSILSQINRVTQRPTFRYSVADSWRDYFFTSDTASMMAGSLRTVQTVYNKASWSNLNDFNITGIVTNSGITITTTNALQVNKGAGDFNQYIQLADYQTSDNMADVEVTASVDSAVINTSYGFGVGMRSVNPWFSQSLEVQYDFFSGVLVFSDHSGATLGSRSTYINTVLNDVIKLKYVQRGNIVSVVFTNVTQKKTITASVFANWLSVTAANANTSKFTIWNHGGKYSILKIDVVSNQVQGADVAVLADSKGLLSSGSYNLAWPTLVQKYGTTSSFSGIGDRTVEAVLDTNYILRQSPKTLILHIGRNDSASSVPYATWTANYTLLRNFAKRNGIKLIHLLPVPETVLYAANVKTFVNATFPTDSIVDPSVGWSNSLYLYSDGIHPNSAGHRFIADKLLNSGYLTATSKSYQSVFQQPPTADIDTANMLTNYALLDEVPFQGTSNITTRTAGANLSVTGGLSATLTTASQPNITAIGTLSLLTVTNSVTAGNYYTNGRVVSGYPAQSGYWASNTFGVKASFPGMVFDATFGTPKLVSIGVDNTSGSLFQFRDETGGVNRASIDMVTGSINGGSFVKSGGTSSEYLMADGSVTTSSSIGTTYTPTYAGIANVTSTGSVTDVMYTRSGDIVHVSGFISVTATGSGTTTFSITLPVASNFTTASNANGVFWFENTSAGQIYPDTTTDRAYASFIAPSGGAYQIRFTFDYVVL